MTDEIGIIVCARHRLVLWHGPKEEGLLRLMHFGAMENLHPERADYRMLTAALGQMSFWHRLVLDKALVARDYDATIKALAIPLCHRASLPMPEILADDVPFLGPVPLPDRECP
jgi:hypothetical protein